MNIYVAARHKQRDMVRQVYAQLEALGHTITTKWTEYGPTDYERDVDGARERIEADLEGVRRADAVILLSEYESDSRGSHVELGYALKEAEARPLKIFVVFDGDRPSMFYQHPAIQRCRDLDEVLNTLQARVHE